MHQWYWSYEYSDFINDEGESIEFDSYMIPENELEEGQLRLLEVDNKLVIPVDTHVRFIVTGADVIHNFAVPALGIKLDAIPGRLNQTSVLIQREGTYYGQCSELCLRLDRVVDSGKERMMLFTFPIIGFSVLYVVTLHELNLKHVSIIPTHLGVLLTDKYVQYNIY